MIALLLLLDDIDNFIWNAKILDLHHPPHTVRISDPASAQLVSIGLADRRGTVQTYIVPAHIDLRYAEEAVAVGTGLDDFFQDEIHPGVAADEMAVEGLAVFELDEHRVALRCGEEA
jgi:hypothetical protein